MQQCILTLLPFYLEMQPAPLGQCFLAQKCKHSKLQYHNLFVVVQLHFIDMGWVHNFYSLNDYLSFLLKLKKN